MFKEKYFFGKWLIHKCFFANIAKSLFETFFSFLGRVLWYARVVSIVKVTVALMTLRGELLLLYKL